MLSYRRGETIEAVVVVVIFLIIAGLIQGTFWLLGALLARPFIILLAAIAGLFFKAGKEYERQLNDPGPEQPRD